MSNRGGRGGRCCVIGSVATSTKTEPSPVRGRRERGSVRGTTNIAATSPSSAPTVVDNFVQAASTNLPKVNFIQVAEYFQNMRSPELRQAKDSV